MKADSEPDADERIYSYTYNIQGARRAYTYNNYDAFNRIISKSVTINPQNLYFTRSFTYDKTRIASVSDTFSNQNKGSNSYSYDSSGRIITDNYSSVTRADYKKYTYDAFGQLIREDNLGLDKTYIYSYNEIGNISSAKEYSYTTGAVSGTPVTTSYTYGNSTHPDRLTSFGGSAIYYDSLGYPTSYGSHRFTWNKGRLASVYRGSAQQIGSLYTDCKFTYDAYGRRLSKSYTHDPNPASTSDYSYTYDTTYNYDNSGRLIREYCTEKYISGTTTTREFIYLYDESSMVGVLYSYNGSTPTPYYYHRNLQGDVIAIYDASGNVKAEYTYDAWGNCTVTNSTLYDLAHNNPIRYRGYYYDRETGLYYLNARYYNPEWRRFISPDSTAFLDPESVNGLNLYCYCGNDPVNFIDPSGNLGFWAAALIGAGILGLVGFGATAYADFSDDGEIFNGSIGADAYFWNTLVAASIGALGGGLISAFGPSIAAFLGSSFSISTFGTINAGGTLALAEATSIILTGADIAIVGGTVVAADIGLIYYAYESKKAAPRIKSSSKKQAYDKAFYKGGKKKPTLHQNGKYGPHFHPANPKYKHWHYYFSFLFVILGIDSNNFD